MSDIRLFHFTNSGSRVTQVDNMAEAHVIIAEEVIFASSAIIEILDLPESYTPSRFAITMIDSRIFHRMDRPAIRELEAIRLVKEASARYEIADWLVNVYWNLLDAELKSRVEVGLSPESAWIHLNLPKGRTPVWLLAGLQALDSVDYFGELLVPKKHQARVLELIDRAFYHPK